MTRARVLYAALALSLAGSATAIALLLVLYNEVHEMNMTIVDIQDDVRAIIDQIRVAVTEAIAAAKSNVRDWFQS